MKRLTATLLVALTLVACSAPTSDNVFCDDYERAGEVICVDGTTGERMEALRTERCVRWCEDMGQ